MDQHQHKYQLKYKVSISGAAITDHCGSNAVEMAEEVGRELARRGVVVITGATTGIPYWAAKGAKEEGGFVIGYSPAASEASHVKTYRLPIDYHDIILFPGFEYTGRNLFIVRSADAMITICGRMGTLNEFTIAFEEKKPVGVLLGSGGTADSVQEIIQRANRGPGKIAYDSDPKRLVEKVIALIEEEKKG
ncbi:MAG: hypothetical protein A3J67_05085 [Parcubacteria group bacterium RIFCSPHIGHO2_02_FULL_48_10b]|nr:MAG: hypothetical protein A3J67_05085 [Parcubacteria group bacterium RIFCSPHIGHO2_02_FULL_48_10b]